MDERNQDSKRVEELLTGGRSRIIRARSVIRPRGELPQTPAASVKRMTGFAAVLEQLAGDVPEAPWVVVVDGDVDENVESLCVQARAARPSSKFWVINSGSAIGGPLPKLRLDPADEADARFIANLVADLVIAPAAPSDSYGQRLRRWLRRARFVVTRNNEEAVAEQLSGEGAGRSVAEVCVLAQRA